MKGKVKRKRPRKRNPARNMPRRQQGTESGRKQNPSNLLSFWATDESGETGIQSSTKKGSKASNEMEGIMLSRVRNQACVSASAQPGRAQDGFAVSNGSKMVQKQPNKTTFHDANILRNSNFGAHKSSSIRRRYTPLFPTVSAAFTLHQQRSQSALSHHTRNTYVWTFTGKVCEPC